MGSKKMWEIFVPTIRANGKPIRTRHHKVWDKKVIEISGGLTIYSPIVGKWRNGREYVDRMIPVRILATSDDMKKIVDITLKHYPDEEAIMAYMISDEYILKERRKNTWDGERWN